MRDSGNIGRAASAGGSREAAARNSNRAAVAYNNIQMIAAPLSVAGGNSALNSETQPPRRTTPRILAIDYGRKRIGLALSDELGITAQPLQTLMHKNRRDDVRRLRDICRAHGVARILVAIRCILPAKPGKWRMKRRGLRRGCAKNWGSK